MGSEGVLGPVVGEGDEDAVGNVGNVGKGLFVVSEVGDEDQVGNVGKLVDSVGWLVVLSKSP